LGKLKDYISFFGSSNPLLIRLGFILALVILSVYYQYHKTVFYPPQSVHAWRQADCASLALNYYKHGMNFFYPRIHLLVSDDGTSGYCATSEIPLFYYTVAILYKIFGVNEFLMRAMNLLIFISGMYYLFRLLYKLLKDYFWSGALAILIFTSPLLVYYANNYLTNASALALGIIGFYHFYSFHESKRVSSLYYSALFYLLAGSFKITGLFMVFPIIAFYFIERIGIARGVKGRSPTFPGGILQIVPFIIVLLIVSSWIVYARYYNTLHGSSHFSTTVFPIWNFDMDGIRGILHNVKNLWMPSYFNKYTLVLIGLLGLSIPVNYRHIHPLILKLTILLLPVIFLFILFQFWTFRDHDYYAINLYILVVMVLAGSFNGLMNRFPGILKSYVLKGLFAGFILLNIAYARGQYRNRYTGWMNENSEFLVFREIRDQLPGMGINPLDTVICLPGGSPLALYLLDMKGWTEYTDARFGREEPRYYNRDSTGIRESIDRGARYLFVMGLEEIYRKPYLIDFTHSLSGRYKDILVFDLLSDTQNFNPASRQLKLEVYCDMESLSAKNKYFNTTNDSVQLDHGKSQSKEMAFSGQHSSKLSQKEAFSLTTTFENVTGGESVVVSAWIYDPKDECRIIASGEDPELFYYNRRTIVVGDSLGWRKIQIDFFIPNEIHSGPLNIYMYYPGSDSAYVDDFRMQYFEKPDGDRLRDSIAFISEDVSL